MEREINLVLQALGTDTSLLEDYKGLENVASASLDARSADIDVVSVWHRGVERLKEQLDKQIFQAWIQPLKAGGIQTSGKSEFDNKLAEVTLIAPNKFCCDHVQRHYGVVISETLQHILGVDEAVLSFKVAQQAAVQRPSVAIERRRVSSEDRLGRTQRREKQLHSVGDSCLNPRYNFSNYVVGGCNQFAHAVSLKVSENLGSNYNPLFLYGGVGLGKTHLANAIGNAARRRGKNVKLISSETFVSELIASLKTNNMTQFKAKFRSLDLLIVDDIQFIIGKERTQEEFFHTFNELYNKHSQIIITSDKTPQELTGLEELLRTRFACGLSADLQPLDLETRIAILTKKAELSGIMLPSEVITLLSEKIDTNVRELEGALNRLQAMCSLNGVRPTMELAEEVVRSVTPGKNREVTTEVIQKIVATRFNVSVSDMLGKRRTHNIAFARQVAMYLTRKFTACSYPEIGALFGGRDHSTVIHAHKVITERITKDEELAGSVKSLEKQLTAY